MSQHQIILSILETGGWHCSSEFYAQYIADPRTRLCEIKKKGIALESQTCNLHDYHKGGSKMWRLVQDKPVDEKSIKTPHNANSGVTERSDNVLVPIKGIIENETEQVIFQAQLL